MEICKFEHDGDCCNSGADRYMCHCKKPCNKIVPLSNGDLIRRMTDRQLADKILEICNLWNETGNVSPDPALLFCDGKANCIGKDGEIICDDNKRLWCVLRWLGSPAEVPE